MPDLIRYPVTVRLIEHLTSLDSGFRRNDESGNFMQFLLVLFVAYWKAEAEYRALFTAVYLNTAAV